MRVLLVEPRNCWRGLNIALAYLAAVLKKNGIDVFVLDMANHRDIEEELLERHYIDTYRPDLIGIAIFYISYYPVKEMIRRMKRYCDIPIVVGGPQMMIEKENILTDIPELDFAVVGEGEHALLNLCRALEGQLAYSDVKGLIFRRDGTVVRNEDPVCVKNIDAIPFPDYDPFGVTKIRTYTIITSRGCPFSCSYCFRSTPNWRPRSPLNIVQELEQAIDRYHIEEFAITDDAFNILPDRVTDFCGLLLERGIRLPWYCTGVRPDRVTETLIRKMKQAGCYSINIGVETLDEAVYGTLNRSMTISQVKDCIKILKANGMRTTGYFMIGLPGETKETTMETYRKSKLIGVDDTSYAILLPFPGTKLHDVVYANPRVRKLNDYKTVSTIWTFTKEFSVMKTAFETPEYSATEKIEAYHAIRTKEGDPRPPYTGNKLLFVLHCLYFILKYDFWRSPKTTSKLAINLIRRLLNAKGRHVYRFDTHYRPELLNELAEIQRKG